LPDTVKFKIKITGEEKVACSKKCKKVTKFGYILKRTNESEILK